MIDPEFIKWLATLGVGGILAAFMFHFYRKDVKSYTDQWRGQSEALIDVVRENSSAMAELRTVILALHRRLDDNHFEFEAFKRKRRNDPDSLP